jgi:two-component system response regulator NreC
MNKIRVVIAEDHTIVRKGIKLLLKNSSAMKIVDEVESGKEAIQSVKNEQPDVVLMDISMPGLNGLEATRKIKKEHSDTRVLILTVHTSDKYVSKILRCGASGYILKTAAPKELIKAIKTVVKGEKYFSSSISSKIIDKLIKGKLGEAGSTEGNLLTNREVEILQLISEGYTNKEIAGELHISVKTVESHRSNIMEKLDLHSPVELTKYAIEEGIIEIDRDVESN